MGVVGDDVVEAGFAVEVVVGGEHDHRAVVSHGAVDRVGDAEEADRVAIDVVVVGQEQRGIDRPRSILDRRNGIFHRYRGIVERGDVDDCGAVRGAFAIVGDGIGEAVVARERGHRGIDRERRDVAVEATAQGGGLDVAAQRAGHDEVEPAEEGERNVTRKRTRGGVDRQPCRQRRAAAQRGAPHRAIGLRQRRGDTHMAEFDYQRAAGGLEHADDPQRILVAVEIVLEQIGQRETDGLVLERGDAVGVGVGPLAGWLDRVEDQRRLGRVAALPVGRIVGDDDRAIEVLRRANVDLVGRSAQRNRIVFNDLERVIDHRLGDHRHRGQSAAGGNIEAYRNRADPRRRRGAGVAQRRGVKVQP